MNHIRTSIRAVVAGAAVLALLACDKNDLNLVNPNSATVDGASADPTAFQLLATGLQVDQRGTRLGMINYTGILGRESYNLQPTEGRNTTHFLIGILVNGQQVIDPSSGFATAPWGGQSGVLRDVFNFKKTVASAPI